MPPTVFYLLGFPGVGKLTVAREIGRLSGAIVVDNQLINAPIFALFAWDGHVSLPPGIWDRIAPIRDTVFETLAELTPRSLSYVLTNVIQDDEEGRELFHRVEDLAARRGALFVPVVLSCPLEEELRRVARPDRAERFKVQDADAVREMVMNTDLLMPDHPNALNMDTTSAPADVGRAILEHAEALGRHSAQ